VHQSENKVHLLNSPKLNSEKRQKSLPAARHLQNSNESSTGGEERYEESAAAAICAIDTDAVLICADNTDVGFVVSASIETMCIPCSFAKLEEIRDTMLCAAPREHQDLISRGIYMPVSRQSIERVDLYSKSGNDSIFAKTQNRDFMSRSLINFDLLSESGEGITRQAIASWGSSTVDWTALQQQDATGLQYLSRYGTQPCYWNLRPVLTLVMTRKL
jgi:hypothetical protein